MSVDVVLMIAITIISGWLFFKNIKVGQNPSILGWFIALLTTSIALGSFIFNLDEISWDAMTKGSLFFANTGLCIFIFARIIFLGGLNFALRWFDWVSLSMSVLVIIYWLTNNDPFGANLAIQALMVVSYVLIIQRVVESKGTSDDPWFWSAAVVMSLISIASAQGGEILEIVNTWRSVVSTGIVFSLLLFFKRI